MNLINHSLHLEDGASLWPSDPLPPRPAPPLLSLHLSVFPPYSSARLSAVTLPSVWWDFTDIPCWHIQTIVLPLWVAQVGRRLLQHGPVTRRRSLPSQASLIRERGTWNGFDRIVLHLLSPRTISPCFSPPPPARSAATERSAGFFFLPFPKSPRLKPAKSTELSRSDGRGQNSIWCALFVDCVRLVAEGTRRGALPCRDGSKPPAAAATKPPPVLPNNEKWKILQLV